MEKEIIIGLRGRANTGKTWTLCILKDLITIGEVSEENKIHAHRRDFREVLRYKGKNVAITSYGDSQIIMEKNIKFLRGHDWDFAISATRTRGKTVTLLTDYAHELGIEPYWQHKSIDKAAPFEVNLQCAKKLLGFLDSYIDGKAE
ncbi:MAG: hypothetical protein LUI08_03940 [Prevotella sp.]|nr:hypothetical protein [Prevotella sp.]